MLLHCHHTVIFLKINDQSIIADVAIAIHSLTLLTSSQQRYSAHKKYHTSSLEMFARLLGHHLQNS